MNVGSKLSLKTCAHNALKLPITIGVCSNYAPHVNHWLYVCILSITYICNGISINPAYRLAGVIMGIVDCLIVHFLPSSMGFYHTHTKVQQRT